MPTRISELEDIESYCDTVPRSDADVEDFGPLTLFVSRGSFPYYARPALDGPSPVTADQAAAVRARQRELGVPEAFEWIQELAPDLAPLLEAAGMVVYRLPLMLHRRDITLDAPAHVRVRILGADDPALPAVEAARGIGFASPGTAVGPAGDADRVAATMAYGFHGVRAELASGRRVMAAAFNGSGPVSAGCGIRRGDVAEITGVATLPAYRRRGYGTAVTQCLVRRLRSQGVRLCFLSAASDDIARVYERAGFDRIGTACLAAAA